MDSIDVGTPLSSHIEELWIKKDFTSAEKDLIGQVISHLDRGELRVCEKSKDHWVVKEWIKKAILLFFRTRDSRVMDLNEFSYFDKVPIKKWSGTESVRVVPPAVARFGSFIEPGCILMPSYVNIGAYIGSGTMIDTWATIGSCAQIGKNVHISGGVGIGGVLEPLQAKPVVIEEDCFIGSRAILVEGVWVERGAVLGAGVVITGSTKIIDVTGPTPRESVGHIPPFSVVIPGVREKKFQAGSYGVPCALIVGKRNSQTDLKVSLNAALRDFFEQEYL